MIKKLNIKFLAFFIFLYTFMYEGVCQSQTVPIEEKAYSFAVGLLKAGTYRVDILDTPPITTEQDVILRKMQASLLSHSQWTKEMIQRLAPGEPLPYHENLGINEDEYRSILTTFESDRLVKVDSTTVCITHEDHIITFAETENDEQSLLDYFYIDTRNHQIYIDEAPLAFSSHLLFDRADSRFAEAWHGYTWEYQDLPVDKAEDLDLSVPLDATLFKCTVGKMEETGNIILYITAKIIEKGESAVDTRIMLVLRK